MGSLRQVPLAIVVVLAAGSAAAPQASPAPLAAPGVALAVAGSLGVRRRRARS